MIIKVKVLVFASERLGLLSQVATFQNQISFLKKILNTLRDFNLTALANNLCTCQSLNTKEHCQHDGLKSATCLWDLNLCHSFNIFQSLKGIIRSFTEPQCKQVQT